MQPLIRRTITITITETWTITWPDGQETVWPETREAIWPAGNEPDQALALIADEEEDGAPDCDTVDRRDAADPTAEDESGGLTGGLLEQLSIPPSG